MTRVSEALSAFSDLNAMLGSVVAICVPTLFDAMRIEAGPLENRPEIVVGEAIDEARTFFVLLNAGGGSFGKLSVSNPRDDIDRDVAADIAKRIASALHTASALARERRVADTLQRALLPETLPQSARVNASAAYLPGTQEAIVGGDWYDVFDLRG